MSNEFLENHKGIYAVIWPFISIAYIPFGVLRLIFYRKVDPPDWWREWENLIDDPVDTIKEYLHCFSLPFGYQLNISFLMKNRKTTWDIIRKRGQYENCDPEDLSKTS